MTRHPFEACGKTWLLSVGSDPEDPPYRILEEDGCGFSVPWNGFDRRIAQLEARRAEIEVSIQVHKAAKRLAEELKRG